MPINNSTIVSLDKSISSITNTSTVNSLAVRTHNNSGNQDFRVSSVDELRTAIGLVWGFFDARDFKNGATLAAGCLQIWPDNVHLKMLHSACAVELRQSAKIERSQYPQNEKWQEIISIIQNRFQRFIKFSKGVL